MIKAIWVAAAAMLLSTSLSAQSETVPSDVVPRESVATRQGPKIHIVAVVDASGCKNLNGGVMSGGGMLLGGLLARKAGTGAGGIMAAAEAGKALGNMHDKAQRCRQEINVDKAVMAGS